MMIMSTPFAANDDPCDTYWSGASRFPTSVTLTCKSLPAFLTPSAQALAQERLLIAPVVSSATEYCFLGAVPAVPARTATVTAVPAPTRSAITLKRALRITPILSLGRAWACGTLADRDLF